MSGFLVVVALSTGCCNCGDATWPPGFVKDVTTTQSRTALKCHNTASVDESIRVAKRFSAVFVAFARAAETARETTVDIARNRNQHVAAGLRSTAQAANTTFAEPSIRLFAVSRALVARIVQSVFAQPSATNGVLWDERKLLDEVSRIA